MRVLFKSKDGGIHSKVTGYWLFESKRFGSIVLLCFDKGSREVFHTHAFNAISWIIKGSLKEILRDGSTYYLKPSYKFIYTPKSRFHMVFGEANRTYVLSFRGPWDDFWKEYNPINEKEITLTNGRIEV